MVQASGPQVSGALTGGNGKEGAGPPPAFAEHWHADFLPCACVLLK